MNSLFPRASLMHSHRTRARKDNVPAAISRSSSRRKTRPPPLQIIPELSENELDFNASPCPPATARPTQFTPRQSELHASRITLSAYDFSINDALLMFGDDTPRSPALSASSSTSDGASSEDVLPTPGTSDDEDAYTLPTPRLCPRRISIRPLCITKTRSLVCPEGEDIHDHFEKEEVPLPVIEEPLEQPIDASVAGDATQEADQDFYTLEFEDFISLSSVAPSPTFSARRDSLILNAETFSGLMEVPEWNSRGRSRLSKPLPLLPPTTPPISTLPSISTFPLVETSARTSMVRRKRNVSSLPNNPPPSPPAQSRPLPRVAIPFDIEDCTFSEEDFDATTRGPIVIEQVYDTEEDACIYSPPSIGYGTSASTRPLPPAMPETPLAGMYGEVGFPRASIYSDAPRSSVDSISSFVFSATSNTPPVSPYSFPSTPSSDCYEPESTQRLCSRWSCSTLASVDVEPARTTSLLSPLRNVLGGRARRTPPPQKSPPRTPPDATHSRSSKNKHGSTTPSPPSTPERRIRRQELRSSTSSTECDSRDGSPNSKKRKHIPIAMFLRAA